MFYKIILIFKQKKIIKKQFTAKAFHTDFSLSYELPNDTWVTAVLFKAQLLEQNESHNTLEKFTILVMLYTYYS